MVCSTRQAPGGGIQQPWTSTPFLGATQVVLSLQHTYIRGRSRSTGSNSKNTPSGSAVHIANSPGVATERKMSAECRIDVTNVSPPFMSCPYVTSMTTDAENLYVGMSAVGVANGMKMYVVKCSAYCAGSSKRHASKL